MDIERTYGVTVDLHLKAVFWNRLPTATVSLNQDVRQVTVGEDTVVSFVSEAKKDQPYKLSIEHYGKTAQDHDLVNDRDTAIIVDRIVLNGIESKRFVWQGQYTPKYDEAYVIDQKNRGVIVEPVLIFCNYLGWNGIWELEFTAPVFTWIHKLEHLGWIYH